MTLKRNALCRILGAIGAAVLVLAGLWLVPQLSRAASLTVGSDGTYATIQAAIDAASPGDTIRVRNETFNEGLVITKSLTLLGGYEAGFGSRTPRTTFVGSVPGRVIEVQGAGIEVAIDGFEIANGTIVGGNGGGVYVDVEDDSVVTVNDNFIHDNSADDGGGIYADAENRSGLHITGNDVMTNVSTDDYAGIYADVYLSGTLILSANDIVGNVSGDRSGGLYGYVEGFVAFQVEDNLVMSNTTAVDGDPSIPYRYYGGLYFEAQYNSHGTFDRNRVIGNYADDYYGGGRVEMYYNCSTTFYDNEFRDNTANYRNYGGLYLTVYGNSQVSGDNLVVADNTVNGTSYDHGGAYVDAEYNSAVTLPNARITGNRAGGEYGGGHIYASDHSTIRVPDLYVYDNAAGGDYGGVSLDAADGNDTIIATNARVISNTAGGDGGAGYVYLEDGGLVDLTGGRFERNTAGASGGALYVGDIYGATTLLLGQTEFLTNTAGTDGGGIYFNFGPNYGAYLDLSQAHFISNTAETGDGGGFYMDEVYYNDPTAVSIQADQMTFERNTAGDDGGGFHVNDASYGPGQMVFDDGIYRANRAGSDGGGLYWYYCTEGCQLSLSGNRLENNEAVTGDGGGIHFYEAEYGTEVHADDNEFLNNTAGDEGGGFYNYYFANEGALGTFDSNLLRGNTAGGDGGGFFSEEFGYDGANVSFSDNVVVDNTSDGDGGGVYVYYPAYYAVLTFNRNVITGNVAIDGGGGGLYMEYMEYGSRVEFKDNVISQNVISSASEYNGGGIYLYDIDEGSIVRMTGNEINDNAATGDGGGFYIDDYVDYGAVWYFEDNELQRNWAGGDGGGCYFADSWYDGAVVRFNRNLVNDNTAIGDHGGCYVYDIEYAEVDFIDNRFNRNTAGGDYGGLYFDSVYDGAVMRFWDNQIVGNRAGITETVLANNQIVAAPARILGGDYGGLYLEDIESGGEVDFRRNQILSNTAYLAGTNGGDYGGMYTDLDSNGLLNMVDNTIAGNEAQGNFGGFSAEAYGGSRLVMVHNAIRANTAVTESGGVYIYGEEDSQYYLQRNQILDNHAGSKDGLWLENGDTTEPLWGVSENNVIAGNQGGGLTLQDIDFWSTNDTVADNVDYGLMMTGTVTSTAYLSNTVVWGHTASFARSDVVTYTDRFTMAATYSDIEGGWPGMGNVDQDPLFVGGGDYHLQATSPAVDAAETAAAPSVDLDGVPRPVPAGGDADMGAYEWRLPGVSLTPNRSASPDPGTQAVLTHTVSNTGNAQDTFAVSASSAGGWAVEVTPAQVTLPAGDSAVVTVKVDVPAGLAAGTTDIVNVSVASVPNPAVVDGAQDDITVALVPALTFTPDRAAGVLPGGPVVYEHTLTNDGNGTDTFHVGASSSQGWGVTVQPFGVTLAAGSSETVRVYVSVPSGTTEGTTDVTTVTATSLEDATVSASVVDTTTAQGWPYSLFLPLVNRGP